MSKAYVIGHITVKDEAKWSEYRSKVPLTLTQWGGELVCRGTLAKVLDGTHLHKDTVVIKFPDMAALNGWHDSPDYQALIPLRQAAADIDLLAFKS